MRSPLVALVFAALTGCGPYFNPTETRRIDAGADASAAGGHDGAHPSPVFHECTRELFVDRSAQSADRSVPFGGPMFAYNPKCMTIAAGQSVTFVGSFMNHPLAPGTSAQARNAGPPGNPIPDTVSGASITVRFSSAGTFPYFCTQHLLDGMAGVIEVRP